jgi:peptide/nickel transport system permease protein
MKADSEFVRGALLNARQAMQRGDHLAARGWAMQAVTLDPDSEDPWLFLAAVASPRASTKYLEQALKINPHSLRARKGMHWAVERLRRVQAGQSSRKQTLSRRNVAVISKFGRTAQDVSWKLAASEPKTQPQVLKVPAQTVTCSAPLRDHHLPEPIFGFRWSRSLTRFSSRWQNWIGILLVGLFIVIAITAPWISPNDSKDPGPFMQVKGSLVGDQRPHPPSTASPLGSLPGQMDVFHALVWGTRDALVFGLEISLLSAVIGVLLGATAGYAGGAVNNILMRITDAFTAFPIIAGVVLLNQLWVSVIVAAGAWFDSYHNVWSLLPVKSSSFILVLIQAINPLMLILILFSWMPHARIINSVVISIKQSEFILAARAIGAKPIRIILRHLLPNSITPSIVLAARDVGALVILQATFTFINLDSSSTWGRMLVMGKDWVLGPGGGIFTYWWVYIPATLVLILFGIGWNILGDGLSELLDPRDV